MTPHCDSGPEILLSCLPNFNSFTGKWKSSHRAEGSSLFSSGEPEVCACEAFWKNREILFLSLMWMDLNFYSTFSAYWSLKAIHSTGQIHPFTHIFIHWWQRLSCRPDNCSSGTIFSSGSVSCSVILWRAAGRARDSNQLPSNYWSTYYTCWTTTTPTSVL